MALTKRQRSGEVNSATSDRRAPPPPKRKDPESPASCAEPNEERYLQNTLRCPHSNKTMAKAAAIFARKSQPLASTRAHRRRPSLASFRQASLASSSLAANSAPWAISFGRRGTSCPASAGMTGSQPPADHHRLGRCRLHPKTRHLQSRPNATRQPWPSWIVPPSGTAIG